MADREPPSWERQYGIGLIERDYCFHITRVGPLEEQIAQILRPSRRLGHSPSCHAPTVAPQCDIPRPADQVAASWFEQVREALPRAPGTHKHLVHMIFGLITGPGHPVALHAQLASVPANRDLRPDHPSADRRVFRSGASI
jgi:hypothetical protein